MAHQKAVVENIEKKQRITKDMLIGDVVMLYPSSVEILLSEGVHCIGCGGAYFETIEQGLMGHGRTSEDIARVIKRLNASIPKEAGSTDKLVITEKAALKLKELLKKEKKAGTGLRVGVTPGGCAGFEYDFMFDNKKRKDDTVITVQGVDFYVNADSLKHLKGAKVDYVDSLKGAGFKISNPNATSTCSCGQSFH